MQISPQSGTRLGSIQRGYHVNTDSYSGNGTGLVNCRMNVWKHTGL